MSSFIINSYRYTTASVPTWDPATVSSPLSLSLGNRRVVLPVSNSSVRKTVRGNLPITSGKWYWEVFIDACIPGSGTTTGCGIVDSGFSFSTLNLAGDSTANAGGLWLSGRLYFSGSFNTPIPAGFSSLDTMMFAADLDAGRLWVGKNGTWVGDPSSGTGASYTGLSPSMTYYPAACPWSSDASNEVRLDLRGQGFTAYSAPSGFKFYGQP